MTAAAASMAPTATAATAAATTTATAAAAWCMSLGLTSVKKEGCTEIGALNVKVASFVFTDPLPRNGRTTNGDALVLDFTQCLVRYRLAEPNYALDGLSRELDEQSGVQCRQRVLEIFPVAILAGIREAKHTLRRETDLVCFDGAIGLRAQHLAIVFKFEGLRAGALRNIWSI